MTTLHMTWDRPDGVALSLDPLQGHWTEEQYLLLTDQTTQLLEYSDGVIEVLAMPTRNHQALSRFLFLALFAFVQQFGGTVFYAPLRLQVRPGKFREPDLLLLCDAQDPRNQDRYWLGADLVVEIVSPDDPERDTEIKVGEYAAAHIPEYWIVNPLTETITVLVLDGTSYREHGIFQGNEWATSLLLEGFKVQVDAVFHQAVV
ncbi:Uma2 family endonuclease [Candidatus Viridilinea mediisalina]|uniref:Putative restriction endonuclease domain-containing protein n=1 Tax=Candidatus Viridilinea mediisalina TaxID=2024553 RepID=A0A2A6REW9_9CHLR|nr:Uma2 family endonuclease [Candidatus Viridilinea mediisalina]PDW01562.1 hypothetical protein CJ255_18465 [Candidatus Viridilinea mediisalina]